MMLPDALDDFRAYDAVQAAIEEALPKCSCCGEPIQEKMYKIGGETLCEDCLDWKYAESVEDYMNDNYY